MAIDYDVQGALAAGISLPQIADYLGQRAQFDVAEARKAGHSDVDIIGSLAGSDAIEGLQGGTGNLSRGAQTALGQTVPTLKGVAGLIGATAEQAFGEGGFSTALKNWGLKGYKAGMEKIQPLSRDTDELTTAWQKAKQGDLGALVDWGTWAVGYGLGQIGESAAMAVVGGVAGAAMAPEAAPVTGAAGAVTGLVAKGAVKDMAQSLIEKAVVKEANRLMAESGGKLAAEAATKQATKAVATSIGKGGALLGYETGMELGSIYADAEKEAREKGRELDGADLAKVWGTGILSGSVGALGDKVGLDAVTGKLSSALPGGRTARMVGGAMVAGASNSAEESVQTMLERAGAGKEVFSPEGINDIINSAGAGFMGSAPAGAFGGIISRQRQDIAVDKGKATLDQDMSVGGAQKAIDAAAAELRGATDAYMGVPPGAPGAAPQGRQLSSEAAAFLADRPMPTAAPQAPMGEGGLLPAQIEAQKALGIVPVAERRSLAPGAIGPEATATTAAPVPGPTVPAPPSGRTWSPEATAFLADRAATGKPEGETGQPGGADPEVQRINRLRALVDQSVDTNAMQATLAGYENGKRPASPLDGIKGATTTQADVQQLIDAARAKKDAAETAEIERMLADDAAQAKAQAAALVKSSADETAQLQAQKIATDARAGLVSHLLERFAEPNGYFASGVIKAINKQLSVLQREPLAAGERARIDDLLGRARAFIEPALPADKAAPVVDRGADNALLESQIKPQPTPESIAQKEDELQVQRALKGYEAGQRPADPLAGIKGETTTQADVQQLVAAVRSEKDAAETAEIERMLAEDAKVEKAKADAVRQASDDETARAKAQDLADTARRKLADHLVERFAEPNGYFASGVIQAVNKQLSVLGREPLSRGERARIDALLGRTRAFLQPNLPTPPEKVVDRGADNATMESLIPERGAKGPAGTPGTQDSSTRVLTGKSALFEGYGASAGSVAEGNRRQLLVDPNGGYYWGDWAQESERDGGAVAGGADKGATPAAFATSKEARAAAEATPLTKTKPSAPGNQAAPAAKPKVPRPAKVGGVPTAQLTDEQLSATASNDQLPAITRRGATVELQAREEERQAKDVDLDETRTGMEVDAADVEALREALRTDTDPATGKPIHSQGRRNELATELENLEGSVATAEEALAQTEKQAPATVESLMAETRRYHSGMSATGDQAAAGRATGGHSLSGVGVEVGSLTTPGIKALAHNVVVMNTSVFVDSGAFGAFNKGRVLSFDRVLAKYDQISDAIFEVYEEEGEPNYPRPLFVMPDVIGDQAASLALIEKHKDWITAELDGDTSRLIIPIQKGDMPMAEAYRQIVEILGGRDNFIVGIPSNKEAISAQEFEAFLAEAQPRAVHILGAAATSKLAGRLQSVINADLAGKIHITADASTAVQQRRNNPVPEGSTRGQELEKSTLDQNDPGVTGEKTEGSTRASTLVNQRFEAEERKLSEPVNIDVASFEQEFPEFQGYGITQITLKNNDIDFKSKHTIDGYATLNKYSQRDFVNAYLDGKLLPAEQERKLPALQPGARATPSQQKAWLLERIDEAMADALPADETISSSQARTTNGKREFSVYKGEGPDRIVVTVTEGANTWRMDDPRLPSHKRVLTPLHFFPATDLGDARKQAERVMQWIERDGKNLVKRDAPKVTFAVPNSGIRYTVVNTVPSLQSLRKKIETSPGFQDTMRRPAAEQNPGVQRGSASAKAAIENMIDEGDAQAAVDYAAHKGLDLTQTLKNDPARLKQVEGLTPTADEEEAPAPKAAAPAIEYPLTWPQVIAAYQKAATIIQGKTWTNNLQTRLDARLKSALKEAGLEDYAAEWVVSHANTVHNRNGLNSGAMMFISAKELAEAAVDIAMVADPKDQAKLSTQRTGDTGTVQDGETKHSYTVVDGLTNQAGLTKVLREIARVFGKQVVFFQSDTLKADGFVNPGNSRDVHINADSKMSPVAVLGHELMHLFKMDNPAAYRAIATVLARQVDAGGRAVFRADYGLGANMEELSADLLGNAFQDPGFLASVFAEIGATAPEGQARSIVQRLVAALNNAIAAALKVIQDMGVQPGFKADMIVKDLQAVRSALRLAMVEYGKGQREQAQDEASDSADAALSRQRIFGDNDRQRTPEQLAMFQRIGRAVEEPTIKERIASLRQDLGKKLVQGIVDQFSPLKEISTKAYQLARLSKGASGAMDAMLHHGKLSLRDGVYDADMSGGVLERLGVPLHGEFDDFLNWVAGNRAARLMMEGRENLFSRADIAAARTLADGTTNFDYVLQHGPNAGQVTRDRSKIYDDALKTFNEFNKNTLDIAEQSGLIDPESRKVWESEFYVPFYRVSEEGFMGDTLKNGLVRQKVIQKLKGGQEKLNDLMSNTLLNWAHLIDAAAKNRAALASLESAQQMGLAIEASEDVSRQMAKAMGIKSQVVWAMDGGKRRFFVVEDKAMLQAITSLQYAGLKGPLMDAMGAFKNALTIGVTASPAFKIRNLARDSIQAIASAPLSYNLFQNLADGYKASDPKSQTYVSALASGGLIRFGTMVEGNEAARTRRLVKMGVKDSTILNSKGKLDAIWTKIEKGFMAYQELGNRGEEINRAALYKQLIDQGVPHGEAALQARDLMDFSLQGTFTTVRFLSQVVPFLNARLQGLYKLGRAGKEDPRRFAVVLGSVALASVALMMAYKDDDEWKKREDWDRNNYWWFKFGGEAFRIPKPFEIGAIATLGERGLDYFINPEMTGRRLYENVRDILMDQLSMNPIPQAVKPILDIYSNKDSFSGRPIEPMGMDRLRPDYRYTSGTSMLARGVSTAGQAVANQVNGQFLSPVQVDHLLHGYFSWLGSFVVGASDLALRPLTGQPDRPAADFWKVATQGIVQDANSPQSRYVSQMYQQAKEVEQAYSTWNMLRKQGRLEEASQFLEANADSIQRYKQVEKVKERETKINERIRMIERSAMSADDKKTQISELQAMRDQTARLLAE